MKAENIKKIILEEGHEVRSTIPMLLGEIPGASVFHHTMLQADRVQFVPDPGFMRILFLYGGTATFSVDQQSWNYGEKAVFVGGPSQTVDVVAETAVHLIEIQWEMKEGDQGELAASNVSFPFAQKYGDALQYRDFFKSEKTISRAIIPQRIIPRFAMGSVETYGDDLVGQHEHPLLDQFFFSFPENNMDLLLDDIVYPMGGNTLLHIPLACNHGVRVIGQQCAHYIWIDFIFDDKGVAYLDKEHKLTGTKREF